MTLDFSSERFFRNVSYLIKLQKKKVGEVEAFAGVSPGYIARMRNDTSAKPGIDIAMKLAHALNVYLDDLLWLDFTQLNGTQQYVLTFMDKLITDTKLDNVIWNVETPRSLAALEPDINGEVDHPMFFFSMEPILEDGKDTGFIPGVCFNSTAYGPNTTIWDNCYNLRLKNGLYVYVMFVGPSNSKERCSYEEDIELWLYNPKTGKQFICHSMGATPYASKLCDLYSELKAADNRPRIPKDMMYSIDAFMKGDLEDDPEKGWSDPFAEQ